MEIISYRKNILGTMSFTMKLANMRKSEEFSVYPIKNGDKKIFFQSKTRWAEMDLDGNLQISAKHNYPNPYALQIDTEQGKARKEKVEKEKLFLILSEIRKTSGKNVGGSFVKSDNSGAAFI